ncbi:MAG: radical SAM protein [Proteobacteria bacterium]|nr:radical SAM protein [Pseudomonadota bacterium]
MAKKIDNDQKKYGKAFQVIGTDSWQKENERYKQMRAEWDDVGEKLYVTKAPLHVDIELTNDCNLKCAMCERNFMTRDVGYMAFSLYQNIIGQCAENDILSVKLNLWGESVMHPELRKMISYAKQKGIVNTQFNSNASLLNETICRDLVESGLDRLTLSIDSLKKGTYEHIRIGSKINQVVENIDTLTRIKKELGSKTPFITAQIIQMKSNQGGIQPFVNQFKDKVDYVSVTNICAASGDRRILKQSLLSFTGKKFPCPEIWHRLSISFDGHVTVCCQDYNFDLEIGNLKDSDIVSLWHGKALTELRERHKHLDFKNTLCQTCTANEESIPEE